MMPGESVLTHDLLSNDPLGNDPPAGIPARPDVTALPWRPPPPVMVEQIDISEHLLTDIAMRHLSR